MAVQFPPLSAIEILNSRGQPTLAVSATLADGGRVRSDVPSVASVGSREAVELRDHGDERHARPGERRAEANVNALIVESLTSQPFTALEQVDLALRALDGMLDKPRLGANAIVGVSIVAAQAFASESGQPLWQWLITPANVNPRLSVPHFDVVNGGAHALNDLDSQEFMIALIGGAVLA